MADASDLADFARTWPDYPLADLPPIPEGFGFYWSAMYPMFTAPALRLGIVVEYPDRAMWEDPEEGARFVLFADGPEDGDCPTDIIETDNWNAILGHIDRHKATLNA